jgi:pilus assembly protein CpaB
MRARTIILLIVALVLAGGTTMMARVWLASQRAVKQEAAPIAVPTPSKSVLIVRSSIQRGQILRADDLAWEPWPEGGIDRNYILLGSRTPETYAGWVARQPIAAGEPLIEAKIVAPGNRGFLAAVLHPGMRAVSVPVTVTSGISGFVFPGDQVDLIVTYSVQDKPLPGQVTSGQLQEHKISETVLRDVRVIAIDQKLDSKAGEATVAKTATFEVTPKESEIVALASEMGKLSLSLRSLVPGPAEATQQVADSSSSPSGAPGSPLSETYTVDSDISPLLHAPDAQPSKPDSKDKDAEVVTILRGGQSSATSAVQAQQH